MRWVNDFFGKILSVLALEVDMIVVSLKIEDARTVVNSVFYNELIIIEKTT